MLLRIAAVGSKWMLDHRRHRLWIFNIKSNWKYYSYYNRFDFKLYYFESHLKEKAFVCVNGEK